MNAQHASPPKQTAFLVLAHHQPEALIRLLDLLKADWAHAFVHVDSKAPRRAFEDALAGRSGCTLLAQDQSVPIYWAGFSMVAATLRLLRLAHADERHFQRFALLSGVDMPIKPLSEIADRLRGEEEIIRIDRVLDPDGNGHFDRCANRIYLGDNRLANPRSTIPLLPALARKLEFRLRNTPYPDLNVYYGPSWWCLTRSAITEVFDFVRTKPKVMAWLQRTRSPDEIVFQTILGNSRLATAITYDLTRGGTEPEPTAHGSHFVDWSRPNPDAPRTLTLEDLPLLLQSEALFARKFDNERSRDLIAGLLNR